MSVGKLPADPETWKSKAAALGVDNTNTQDLAQTASASKMPDKQFYALRVLWTRHKASEIEGVFLEQEYDGWAKEQMQKDTHWELLLSAVQSQMRPESTPFLPKEHKIGEYGDLYEAQYDIAYPDTLPNNDNDDNDDDDDDDNDDDDNEDNEDAYGFCRPKIWLLPKDSRQGYRYEEYLRKKGTEQPSPLVHAGTHKAAKAGASSFEMTGLMETLPQTPTQRTPQASLHYHLQTPTSAIIQQTPVVGTKAPDPGLQKTTESFGDEAKVEFALHLFMRKLLRRFIAILGKPKTKAQWEQTHVWLKFGDWVAVTDGHLKSAHNQTKAIVEVKPFSRNISIDRIRRQESGQMAAWIYSEPKEGLSQGHGRKWRLLVAQDRAQIWLIIGEYDIAYERYLRNDTYKKDGLSFLKMHEYGPLATSQKNTLKLAGQYILAFTRQLLESEDGIKVHLGELTPESVGGRKGKNK